KMSFKLNRLKNLTRVEVAVPKDEDGFLGRECPALTCEGYFKIKPGTGLTGEDLPCTCPYCGHTGSPNTFWTKEQLEYAKSIAKRKAVEALRNDLKSMEFSHGPTGPLGLTISMKLKPGTLPPIRQYREKSLETKVTCDSCALNYSVFGVFAYCPDCSVHNSLLILRKNLNLIDRQLTLAESVEEWDLQIHLIEDALENCVSAFDGFARETCLIRALKSSNAEKCKKLTFQNLLRAASILKELFGIEIAASLTKSDWHVAHVRFMQRHLLAHKAGVVDQKFLEEVGQENGIIGRRISIAQNDVRELLVIVESLGTSLIEMLPKPL
ncbi:MAG TPA: hypothetical protein PLL77_15780, partial [Pyrinomonadaceae bacterium]|nr:hypothetical protein [Pyrinomonadaceae bacterium]